MFEPPVVEVTQRVCEIDLSCLLTNLDNPAVIMSLLYGALVTLVALTPTEKDDKILARMTNIVRKYRSSIVKLFSMLTKK